MTNLFIMDENKNIIPAYDAREWAEWFTNSEKIIAKDAVGDLIVSTIFLGLRHSWSCVFDDWNFFFETATRPCWAKARFANDNCNIINRYRTYDEAKEGHRQFVESLKKDTKGEGEHKG